MAGVIVVQLIIQSLIEAGKIATTHACHDIERSGVVDTFSATGVGNDNFLHSLDNIITKLNVFVRIVDQGSKVCKKN
jgi:hypothetical protein